MSDNLTSDQRALPEFAMPEKCASYRDNDYGRKHPRNNKQWQCAKCKRWCWRNDMCNLFEAVPKKNGELP